jgi:propionyl-CoA carboxylase alpha chain
MNTRLQVEHPVTECITGLDLVEWMIRIAAGQKLPFTQDQVARRGWAIECRINAEDPSRGFLPSTGRLVRYQPPQETLFAAEPVPTAGGIRVDTGVYEGGEIPVHYDSMIAKLIAYGRDRPEAIARMRAALDAFVIRGVSSNIAFQSALLAHPQFVAGEFNTGFIAEHYPQGFRSEDVPHEDPGFLVALASAVHRRYRDRAAGISGQLPGRGTAAAEYQVVIVKGPGGEDTHHPVRLRGDGVLQVWVGEACYELALDWLFGAIRVAGHCNGRPFSAQVERRGVWLRVAQGGTAIDALVMSPRGAELARLMPYKPPPDTSKFLLSPMPGLLSDVTVRPGQAVHAGERLAVIEAMKMENILVATQDATVAEVLAGVGESLAVDQPILRFA